MRREVFPQRLKALRRARGLTQAVLAAKVGVTRAYLARLEMGRHDPPLSRLRLLARALRVTVGDLLGERRRRA